MILAMNEKYNNFFNENDVEEIEVTPADYSKCLSFSEACYTAMMEDYKNWDNFEKSIIYYEVSAAEVGERVKYTGRQIKAMGERVIEMLKKFAEKVMGVLLTWRQRVNAFIAKLSLNMVGKEHKELSEEFDDYGWGGIVGKLGNLDYITATEAYSKPDDVIDQAKQKWLGGGNQDLSASNILERLMGSKSKQAVTYSQISKEITQVKSKVQTYYNDQLKVKHEIDNEIKEVKKIIKDADKEMNDDKVKQAKEVMDAYKEANRCNFMLMTAKLNGYNEYVKFLAKAARRFKNKKSTKESTMMFGNFELV